jgi:hypothetical protein
MGMVEEMYEMEVKILEQLIDSAKVLLWSPIDRGNACIVVHRRTKVGRMTGKCMMRTENVGC